MYKTVKLIRCACLKLLSCVVQKNLKLLLPSMIFVVAKYSVVDETIFSLVVFARKSLKNLYSKFEKWLLDFSHG